MMEAVDLTPLSGKVELSPGPIEKLPDNLLEKLFSYLPFMQRYQMCLISKKWAAASRIPWSDVTFLNLNLIPRAMVNPILGLCPKVEVIEAADLIILLEKKQGLSVNVNVHTMKLRNTKLALPGLACGDAAPSCDEMLSSFQDHFERFPNLSDLMWHNVSFTVLWMKDGITSEPSFRGVDFSGWLAMPEATAASLRRLVISHSANIATAIPIDVDPAGMEILKCLYLDGANSKKFCACGNFDLPQLRELCVIDVGAGFPGLAEKVVGNKFPKLEVLICSSDGCLDSTSLSRLITVKLALRVLVIAGRDYDLEIHRNTRVLEWLDSAMIGIVPVQQPVVTLPAPTHEVLSDSNGAMQMRPRAYPLQIFVGGDFTKLVRFTLPPTEVAKFWRIDRPMPEYLAKPEVAEIFPDVFVATIVSKSPAWGHPGNNTGRFFSTEELLFR